MFAKLRGTVDSVNEDRAIIDVNGVGYLVFISSKCAQFLQQIAPKKEVSLIIETIVKEDAIELYGFASEAEKTWFLEVTKVQGVGAKLGLKILGFFTIEDIAKALISSDIKTLSQVPGIGPKLASRIATELKESPKKLGVATQFSSDFINKKTSNSNHKIADDTLSALENLGYRKGDCLPIISAAIEQNPNATLEHLITLCLRELGRKN